MMDFNQPYQEPSGLPLDTEGFETTVPELAGAAFDREAIDRNYHGMRQQRQRAAQIHELGLVSELVYGDPKAWQLQGERPDRLRGAGANDRANAAAMFSRLEELRQQEPGKYANAPDSYDDLLSLVDEQVAAELLAERETAERQIANRSVPTIAGGVAEFAGAAGAAISDIEGVVTLPFGAGQGSLARTVLVEAMLGAGAEAIALPSYMRQSEFLGTEDPNIAAQLAFGAAFGGALPIVGRGLTATGRALTGAGRIAGGRLAEFGVRQGADPAERGAAAALARDEGMRLAAPNGTDPDRNAGAVDAAEAAAASEEPVIVRPADVITKPRDDAPLPGFVNMDLTGKIRNLPLSDEYISIMSRIVRSLGPDYDVRVTSAGQWPAGTGGPRTGSSRHDVDHTGHAHTSDFVLLKDGVEITPREAPLVYAALFERAAPYFPGIGHYDGFVHIGIGSKAAWGPDKTAGSLDPLFRDAILRGRARGPATEIVPDFVPFDPIAQGFDGQIHSFRVSDLRTDAQTYQYKLDGDQYGVNDRLRFEQEWSPLSGVGLIVHERLDGTRYVADGHQRFGLAQRLADQGQDIELQAFVYREEDGFTPKQVRVLAAIENLRGQSGDPASAAKVIRDYPELAATLSRNNAFMSTAQGLADLGPEAFQAIVNDVIPQNYGGLIGRFIPDDLEMQSVAVATIAKADPANIIQAESMIRDIRRMGLEAKADAAQGSLFDDGFDLGRTVISERARILDRTHKELKRDKAVFARLGREANRIEEAGNVLDAEANAGREANAQRALERLLLLADAEGPIRDAIDAAARALRSGTPIAEAVASVIDAIGDGRASAAARSAADRLDEASDAGASLDPRGVDRPLDLFGDPVESEGAGLQLDQATAELRSEIDADRDIELEFETVDGSRTATLSELLQEQADDTEFEQALSVCMAGGRNSE